MSAVYDARTQPENPLLARMWFLLLGRCDAFTLAAEGDEVVISVGDAVHRIPAGDEGMAAIRTRVLRSRSTERAAPRPAKSEVVFAAITTEWQSTAQLLQLTSVARSTIAACLDELHDAGRVERMAKRRDRGLPAWMWRLP